MGEAKRRGDCASRVVLAEREIERLRLALDAQEEILLMKYDEDILSSFDISQAFKRIRNPANDRTDFDAPF